MKETSWGFLNSAIFFIAAGLLSGCNLSLNEKLGTGVEKHAVTDQIELERSGNSYVLIGAGREWPSCDRVKRDFEITAKKTTSEQGDVFGIDVSETYSYQINMDPNLACDLVYGMPAPKWFEASWLQSDAKAIEIALSHEQSVVLPPKGRSFELAEGKECAERGLRHRLRVSEEGAFGSIFEFIEKRSAKTVTGGLQSSYSEVLGLYNPIVEAAFYNTESPFGDGGLPRIPYRSLKLIVNDSVPSQDASVSYTVEFVVPVDFTLDTERLKFLAQNTESQVINTVAQSVEVLGEAEEVCLR